MTRTTASAHHLLDLPYDIFVLVARFMDVRAHLALGSTCSTLREYFATPSLWLALARDMLEIRPLPVPPLRTVASLSAAELRRAVVHAARLEENLSGQARLQSSQQFNIDGGKDLELLTVLPGARHLVTSKEADSIACWDLHSGKCVASWPFHKGDRVLQCRPVDGGRACMFIVFVAGTNFERGWFQLLRLAFTETEREAEDEGADISAEFVRHIMFNEPDQLISDMSLSEDVVTMITVHEDTREVSLVLLSWREGSVCVGRTNVHVDVGPSVHPINWPLFTLLSPTCVNILWDDLEHPFIHRYPNDCLFPHLSVPAGAPITLPSAPAQTIKFENNTDDFVAWVPYSSLAHRHWDTSLHGDQPHLSRELSNWRTFQRDNMNVLAHSSLPVPYDDEVRVRTFFAPCDVVVGAPSTDPRDLLMIAESKHALWLERQPDDVVLLRICSFPSDDMRQLKESPEWYTERLARTLEVPDGLDLSSVCDMALSEAHGIVVLSLLDGTLWTLQY
ncbi:hypothetical protein EXIGLDRAFT_772738 [Exidia glandulosa HHB12029]|uniref:F-box domain-containing protein n=1 Tax=Exidia glandulosa HHB12029 TaxID=1314781 RepID=A0A166A4H6_EXIGL|nr:hypothetical protein EXIGLDRAFT_772738 [Exidia glandulosa HHB12029]